ncbi:MAG: hypothetical protein FJY86_01940 [Candidatus Diapherotrites archaeon]|uniref:Uncharacterized protein n=1 Tax=Candidatus Iainarchaeum sp. TaxID=3101447 RepID=A0A8T4C6I3_9ARCH|nr:hypothetical protein [Candidatus Diapherotrites archaeon]
MANEDAYGGGADLPPIDDGIGSRLHFNLEAVIPILLIVVIGFLLLARLGVIDSSTPVIGPVVSSISPNATARILIIGAPSPEMIAVLNANKDLVGNPIIKAAEAFSNNPENQLAQFDIVIMDQSGQVSKAIPRQLGDALQNYVKTGGKMIIVKDSGIEQPGALDILGWKANFGNIVPVNCDIILDGQPTCKRPLGVIGVIWQQDYRHPIMQGIERVPAQAEAGYLALEVFDVGVTGNEIAYIEDARSGKNFPAIVEQAQLGGGKVLYFNYNPGVTSGIFQNTIKYLK